MPRHKPETPWNNRVLFVRIPSVFCKVQPNWALLLYSGIDLTYVGFGRAG